MTEKELLHASRERLTIARYIAEKEIKERWRSEGRGYLDRSRLELRIAAEQHLAENWQELRDKASAMLAQIRTNEKKRKAARSKASTVQNTCSKVEA